MKIGIDFDRVLFDTDAFKSHLEEELPGFSNNYEEARENGIYNPEKHSELLQVDVRRIFEEIENAKNFLYADVKLLDQVEGEVMIISRGDKEFQSLKIEESGILEYVDGYKVIEEGDKQVENIDVLIDDRKEELEKVEMKTFQFDRKHDTLEDVLRWLKNG